LPISSQSRTRRRRDARVRSPASSGAASRYPVLTDDGTARYARVSEVLAAALASRGRAGIAARVRGAWLALGGPATLCEAIDFEAAERFFELLAKHEVAGDVPEWPAFFEALRTLYVAPEAAETAQVQLMTLHRAKGLEFDTVIPAGPRARAATQGSGDPALAPAPRRDCCSRRRKARARPTIPSTRISALIGADEESAELAACSTSAVRARSAASISPPFSTFATTPTPCREWAQPPSGSALAKCWGAPGVRSGAPGTPAATAAQRASGARFLARLPAQWSPPQPVPGLPIAAPPHALVESIPFDWARETARHVGTIAHRVFAQIAREGLAAWDAPRAAAMGGRMRAELSAEGVDGAELADAVTRVLAAAAATLTEERGRWLFDPAHADARSEWALAGIEDGTIRRIVIDRTFVADGMRWIVDFKTGVHEGADLDAYLEREVVRYRCPARTVRALHPGPGVATDSHRPLFSAAARMA
jgi:hypothetical protein